MKIIKNIFYIVCILLAWLFSLINDSGYGITIKSVETTYIVLSVFSVLLFITKHEKLPIKIRQKAIHLLISTIIFFIAIPLVFKGSTAGLEYLSCVLVVYCFCYVKLSPLVLFITAISMSLGGLFVINQYLYGSMSGWNENKIAMIGFFSYLFFAITFLGKTKRYYKFFGVITTIVYMNFFLKMDSRSCLFGMLLVILAIIFRPIVTEVLKKSKIRVLLFNVPLIIALIVIWSSQSDYVQRLNSYSISEYGKTIFNGRDIIWAYALERLSQTFYIGDLDFMENYHNSGIACLAVFGLLGYITWIAVFSFILKNLESYLYDIYLYGCVCAFLIIFFQQSVELGFICECPNLIIYMILGLAIGRARTIYIANKNGNNS